MEKKENIKGQDVMNILLKSPEQADFTKSITIKIGGLSIEKIVQKKGTLRKVDPAGDVRYQIQKYLFNTKENEFSLGNKNYKNAIRTKFASFKKEDKYIQECIKNQTDDEIAIFKLPKEAALSHYESSLKEINPPEEEKENYDNFIYFRIYIELVVRPKINLPTDVSKLLQFTEFYADELRYYLKNENSSNTDCSSCVNLVVTNVLKMSKKLKKEFDLPSNAKLREQVNEAMTSIFLNRYYLYKNKMIITTEKSCNAKKMYEEFLKNINTYVDFFKNRGKVDEKTLKFYAGYCNALLNILDFKEALVVMTEMEKMCENLKDEQLKAKFEEQIKILKITKDEKSGVYSIRNRNTLNVISNRPNVKSVRKVDIEQKVIDLAWMPGIKKEELDEILAKEIEDFADNLKDKLDN